MSPFALGHRAHEKESAFSQKLRIGYQKVTLDVDLAERTIHGETEITVLPLESSVKEVKLDCHNIQVESVIVNQRRARFRYGDFLQNDEYMNDSDNPVLSQYEFDKYADYSSKNMGIEQHHLYRGKYYPLFSDQNNTESPSGSFPQPTSELIIRVPDSIKLRIQTGVAMNSFRSPMGTTQSINGTPMTANSLMNSDRVYTPLNIKIIYTVKNGRNGIRFYGGRNTDIPQDRWFCYTVNNDLHCSASSWVPCIDNFHEKPAWDINLIIPRTVSDIGETKIIGTKEAEKAIHRIQMEEMDEDDAMDIDNEPEKEDNDSPDRQKEEGDDAQEDGEEEDDSIDGSHPIIAAVPDLVSFKEIDDVADIGKKVVNFQFYNPVSAHHLGFAIGPFEKASLLDLKAGTDRLVPSNALLDSFEDSAQNSIDLEANSNKVPTMLYYLPGKKADVLNTTAFLYKALDFYSKEFSSFPFTSYTLVFLEDFPCETCTFAGMTVASDKLLYGPRVIEPSFHSTEILASALAEQYAGVNVLPKSLNDIWCIIGLSRYMAFQFLKKLLGMNHFKYMIKQKSDMLCRMDIGKRPLGNQFFRFPINCDSDLEFMRLKAPLIMYILNQRMVRTDRSFGLSRVIPKIFLQAMSNDLNNGNCLSTSHFAHVCEKVAHHKLKNFFKNWVFNSGTPKFTITQKFNKKRMFIEMVIRQTQRSDSKSKLDNEQDALGNEEYKQTLKSFEEKHFIDSAGEIISGEHQFEPQATFTGPITIRIHEADGTPYEHILYIRDPYTRFDIQYNTKYRRTRRKRDNAFEEEEEVKKTSDSNKEGCLGDVLMTTKDAKKWGLRGDPPENDNSVQDIQNFAFEWLRFDADGEWICQKQINVSDEMEECMLQEDRDVEAQIEAIHFFADSSRPKIHYANILLRTLVDKRYFYGVRIEAAKALSRISREENDHIGARYLLKAFQHLFCYDLKQGSIRDDFDPSQYHPLPNDFSCFTDMLIMRSIIESLSEVKNKDGDCPLEVKTVLLSVFRYNDNMDNSFDDSIYVSKLITYLANMICNSKTFVTNHMVSVLDDEAKSSDKNLELSREVLMEMNRAVKMSKWDSSYQDCIESSVFESKLKLARNGIIKVAFEELVQYTLPSYNPDTRILAFKALLYLGGLRNRNVLRLFFLTLKLELSEYLKHKLTEVLVKAIGIAALEGTPENLVDDEFTVEEDEKSTKDLTKSKPINLNGMMIVEENSSNDVMKSRRDTIARKTLEGAITILRDEYAIGHGLKNELWEAVHSCLISIGTRRDLLDIISILYPAVDSFDITTDLPLEKKIIAQFNRNEIDVENKKFVVTLHREGRLTIQIPSMKLKLPITKSPVRSERKPRVKLITQKQEHRQKTEKKTQIKTIPIVPLPRVSVLKKQAGSIKILLRFKPNTQLPGAPKKAKCHLMRATSILPIRYIKFNLKSKEIWASDAEFPDFKANRQKIVEATSKGSKIVTLKVDRSKLAALMRKKSVK